MEEGKKQGGQTAIILGREIRHLPAKREGNVSYPEAWQILDRMATIDNLRAIATVPQERTRNLNDLYCAWEALAAGAPIGSLLTESFRNAKPAKLYVPRKGTAFLGVIHGHTVDLVERNGTVEIVRYVAVHGTYETRRIPGEDGTTIETPITGLIHLRVSRPGERLIQEGELLPDVLYAEWTRTMQEFGVLCGARVETVNGFVQIVEVIPVEDMAPAPKPAPTGLTVKALAAQLADMIRG